VRAGVGPAAVLVAGVLAAAAAGCGGSGARDHAADVRAVRATPVPSHPEQPVTPSRAPPPPPGPRADDLGLPPHVPLRASASARTGDLTVIRRWLAALRTGDEARAAGWLNLPTRFQNGGPVVLLSVPDDRLAATRSLTCGLWLERAGGAGVFVVVRLLLVQRPHARCAAAGHTARAAIRVGHGRIVEFYRLPADPSRSPQRSRPGPAGEQPTGPAA
jgi:hypothetical protein